MPGHIFIVPGDVRCLACDAWLIPCSRRARPEAFLPEHLKKLVSEGGRFSWPSPETSDSWWNWERRVLRADNWPQSEPQAWLVNVGYHAGSGQNEDQFYQMSIRQALSAVLTSFPQGYVPRHRRKVPLVAMPFLGGGRGMPMVKRGRLLHRLLELLRERLNAVPNAVDVALVTFAAEDLAAAQRERLTLGEQWSELNSGLQEEAKRLASHAGQGNLALFLGAGIGVGAGLPTWGELLKAIATKAGMDQAEIASLLDNRRDFRDQASYLEARIGEPEAWRETVVSIIGASRNHYSLSHALLAGLPVREATTTNYDQLFERAWDAADSRRGRTGEPSVVPLRTSVIPHRRVHNHDRWLLKLHGCVTKPDTIVLTRESYIRFSSQWAALEGILQATLLTRHMLFIGFSLRDDNFLRIVDAVRRVMRVPSENPSVFQPFGTALMMGRDKVMQQLYHHDVPWVPLSEKDELQMDGPDFAEPARKLELFLDCLLAHTRSSAHLLNQDFHSLLTDDEKELTRHLQQLCASMPCKAERSPAWDRVEALLRSFGWQGRR